MKKIFISLSILILLLGCSMPKLDYAKIQHANYGKYPNNYEKLVKEYYEKILVDPYSVKYKSISKPKKAYLRDIPITGGKPISFGYYVNVCFNAKNRMGGYTGMHCQNLFIKDTNVKFIRPNPRYFHENWYSGDF